MCVVRSVDRLGDLEVLARRVHVGPAAGPGRVYDVAIARAIDVRPDPDIAIDPAAALAL